MEAAGPAAPASGAPPGIRLGGAVLSLVEPHPGRALAFHRWYERDHFYAGCMTGPGFFAGRRFLAPRDLRARRLAPDPTVFAGDPRRGSQLAVYWLDADGLEEAVAWSVRAFHALRGARRIFADADLVHAGFYRVAWWVGRDPAGVPAPLALDHPFAGLVLALVDGAEPGRTEAWFRTGPWRETPAGQAVALTVALAPAPRPEGAVRTAGGAPAGRLALLHFLDGTPGAAAAAFADHAGHLEAAGAGRLALAAPFLPAVPGTDRHVDEA